MTMPHLLFLVDFQQSVRLLHIFGQVAGVHAVDSITGPGQLKYAQKISMKKSSKGERLIVQICAIAPE